MNRLLILLAAVLIGGCSTAPTAAPYGLTGKWVVNAIEPNFPASDPIRVSVTQVGDSIFTSGWDNNITGIVTADSIILVDANNLYWRGSYNQTAMLGYVANLQGAHTDITWTAYKQ